MSSNIITILFTIISVQLVIWGAEGLNDDLLEVNNNQEQAEYPNHENKFREKCLKAHGNENAFADMQEMRVYLSDCVSNIFYNASVLGQELVDANENGTLNDVLIKYCDIKEDYVRCFSPFMKHLEKCMETEDEKKFVQLGMRFIKTLAGHVCYNNGQRTKNLIENGGLECFNVIAGEFLTCFQSTTSLKTMFQAAYDNAFVFEEQKCVDVINYEKCVLDQLKQCNSTAAIDFHNGLFKAIKKVLPCDFTKKANMI